MSLKTCPMCNVPVDQPGEQEDNAGGDYDDPALKLSPAAYTAWLCNLGERLRSTPAPVSSDEQELVRNLVEKCAFLTADVARATSQLALMERDADGLAFDNVRLAFMAGIISDIPATEAAARVLAVIIRNALRASRGGNEVPDGG